MGYYSHFDSTIRFQPAIEPEEVRKINRYLEDTSPFFTVTADGSGLITDGERRTGRTWDHDLEQIRLRALEFGCQMEGTVVREGEEQGDVERMVFLSGHEPKTEIARLTWPDGSVVGR